MLRLSASESCESVVAGPSLGAGSIELCSTGFRIQGITQLPVLGHTQCFFYKF
jgi:hypothetical protein